MNRNYFLLAALGFLALACEKNDDSTKDLTAPTIEAVEIEGLISPEPGQVFSGNGMEIRFKVGDASGVNQVLVDLHPSFDGHTHGKLSSGFHELEYRKIYTANGDIEFVVDSEADNVYWEGPMSVTTDPILAGPYDFTISATDIHGNQTSFASNSSYLSTVVIARPYAPEIEVINAQSGELEGEPGGQLAVVGFIEKTTHSLSSDLAFVWVALEEEHGHSHKQASTELYQNMWGTSRWRSNMSGPALPSVTRLDFEQILSGSNAITLPAETGHFELSVWVEDAEGNVSWKTFEVHVH